MPRNEETGLRPLAHVAGGLVLWVISLVVSMRVLRTHPESLALRLGMVALGLGGFMAWLVAVARLILSQDEFSQRIHFVAIALACAATAVAVMAADFLQAADVLGPVPLQVVWMAMGVLWWLGIVAATRYYR